MRVPLTKYGLREIILGSAFCLGAGALCLWAFAPLLLLPLSAWVFLLAFFRDPERSADHPPHALLSPADGTVRDIQQVAAPAFLEGPALRIGIFMSLLDVHVNRCPVTGTVRCVRHFAGQFHDARDPLSQSLNEHNLIGLETPDGRRVLVNQIAGVLARRIVCAVKVGDALSRGQRIGMVKFGSRLEVFVPLRDAPETRIQVGDRVRAGRDALLEYPPPQADRRRAERGPETR